MTNVSSNHSSEECEGEINQPIKDAEKRFNINYTSQNINSPLYFTYHFVDVVSHFQDIIKKC